MSRVDFRLAEHYAFAAQMLRAQTTGSALAQPAGDQALTVAHPVLTRMLQRLVDGRPVALPFRAGPSDAWLITGRSRLALEQGVMTASRFVVPTYAEYAPHGRLPHLRLFEPAGNELQQLGARLFPEGYYAWRSPPGHFDTILRCLGLWLDLEDQRPTFTAEPNLGYRELHQAFSTALAAANWPEARQVLLEMRRLHISTAENLEFLSIQLLAEQQRWREIWERDDFGILAQLPVPRAVRAALLTAAHASLLVPYEARAAWAEALACFTTLSPRLGRLRTGRLDLTQPAVIQMYAYQAALDRNRDALEALGRASDDPSVRACIAGLGRLLPPAPAAPVAQPPEVDVRHALADFDFDRAIQAAERLVGLDQARSLVWIAFQSGDRSVAERALLTVWDLPGPEREALAAEPRLGFQLQTIEQLTAVPTAGAELAPILSWPDWLVYLASQPARSDLAEALDTLEAGLDAREWPPEEVRRLADALLPVVAGSSEVAPSLVRRAVRALTSHFVRDSAFPRNLDAYAELYETLYLGLLEAKDSGLTGSLLLLRLIDALLRASPDRAASMAETLETWFRRPIPVLEPAVLEAFDLLAAYGVQGSALAGWYRAWIEHLLDLPGAQGATNLASWLAYGEWIRPGADLLQRLQQQLTANEADGLAAGLAKLPAGFRIAIFTLRPASAARAKDQLLKHNPELDVEISAEKDLNDQVRALARSADMPIIVTTSITHALTYGVMPLLKADPVYPLASGASSIMQAVEERLQRLFGTTF